jgi:arylsulfatase A-like enzyme
MYPTLIDLCGLPEKKLLDGQSIKPLLKNPEKKWTPAVTTLGKGNHSIMTEKWHYIVHGKRDAEELYNLKKDPMEWNNLAYKDNKEVLKIKAELMAYLKSYLPEVEADSPNANNSGGAGKKKDKGAMPLDNTIKSKRAETIVW